MNPMNSTLPEAALAPAPIHKYRNTIGYFASFIVLGLTSASLGPTLPGLAANTGVALSAISFLFTARSFGYMLGSLQGGRWYDRLPGHPIMVAVLVAMAVLLALAPLIPMLWLLAAALLLLGCGEGIIDLGSNILLVWTHGERVGPFMNGLHFFFGVGAFLAPIVVAQAILFSGNITWAYWVLALSSLPAAVWLARLPSPAFQAGAKKGAAARVNWTLVACLALLFFLYVGAEAGYGGWIYTYTVRQLGASLGPAGAVSAAYLTSAFWGALTVGRLAGVPIAARFRPRTILIADLLVCLASMAVILLIPHSFTAIWAGTLGLGLGMASFFPALMAYAQQHLQITGKVTAWFLVGAGAGGMTLPWVIGQFFEPAGPQSAMWLILFDLLVTVGFYGILLWISPRSSHSDPSPAEVK